MNMSKHTQKNHKHILEKKISLHNGGAVRPCSQYF